jgi:ABC-type enterobactin transport system permease subunit
MYLTTIASRITGVKYVSAMDATLNGATAFAADDSLSVNILQKGAIPIGTCTTVATA